MWAANSFALSKYKAELHVLVHIVTSCVGHLNHMICLNIVVKTWLIIFMYGRLQSGYMTNECIYYQVYFNDKI